MNYVYIFSSTRRVYLMKCAFVSYVPCVLTCLKCLMTALITLALTWLHFFACLTCAHCLCAYLPYLPLFFTCFSCLHIFKCFQFLTCLKCLHPFYDMRNNPEPTAKSRNKQERVFCFLKSWNIWFWISITKTAIVMCSKNIDPNSLIQILEKYLWISYVLGA